MNNREIKINKKYIVKDATCFNEFEFTVIQLSFAGNYPTAIGFVVLNDGTKYYLNKCISNLVDPEIKKPVAKKEEKQDNKYRVVIKGQRAGALKTWECSQSDTFNKAIVKLKKFIALDSWENIVFARIYFKNQIAHEEKLKKEAKDGN